MPPQRIESPLQIGKLFARFGYHDQAYVFDLAWKCQRSRHGGRERLVGLVAPYRCTHVSSAQTKLAIGQNTLVFINDRW